MCIAIPAKIISLDGQGMAKADIAGNLLHINVRLVSAKAGDYVLVHAGCAVEVLQQESAAEILSLYRELEALAADDA